MDLKVSGFEKDIESGPIRSQLKCSNASSAPCDDIDKM